VDQAVREFADFATDAGLIPALYSVHAPAMEAARAMGWTILQVAEEAVLDLPDLAFRGKAYQDVRTALNHARKEGIEAVWTTFCDCPAGQRDHGSRITDDLSGLVLGCGACFSAVYGLDRAQQTSWTSTSTVSWLALGGIAAALFVVRERFANRPVLPLSMMALPVRAASYATQFVVGAAQMGAIIYLTYYMQNHFGYSPLKSGVVFLPMVLALIATAIPAGRIIVPRLGARGTLPLGLAVLAGSFLIFSRMTTESTYEHVALPGLIVFGMGLGLTMPVTFNSGTRGVDAKRTGLASAILSASQQIGGSFGVALMTSYATQHAEDYVTDHTEEVKAAAMEVMMRAQAPPQSSAGKQIIESLKAQLIDRAQIEAYSGGFSMMAWILAGAVAVLVVCGIGLSLRRHRRR